MTTELVTVYALVDRGGLMDDRLFLTKDAAETMRAEKLKDYPGMTYDVVEKKLTPKERAKLTPDNISIPGVNGTLISLKHRILVGEAVADAESLELVKLPRKRAVVFTEA